MTTVTLQRELKRIAEKHEEIARDFKRILRIAKKKEANLPYGDWELRPSAVRRIRLARRNIQNGKGVVIRTRRELKRFFDEL